MKKLYLFVAYILITLPTFAQLEKGTWMVGGTASLRAFEDSYTINYNGAFNNYNSVSNKLNFKIAPNIGYFVTDKFNVGLLTAYQSSQTFVIDNPPRVNNFFIGPYARYYILNIDKAFNILVDASYQLGYNWWVNKRDIDTTTGNLNSSKINSFSIAIGPVVFLTENVALEMSIGYTYQSTVTVDVSKSTHRGLNTGVGFQYHF